MARILHWPQRGWRRNEEKEERRNIKPRVTDCTPKLWLRKTGFAMKSITVGTFILNYFFKDSACLKQEEVKRLQLYEHFPEESIMVQ